MIGGGGLSLYEHIAIICMVIVGLFGAAIGIASFVGGLVAFYRFCL